jgi:hypothetical protein
MKTRFCLFFFVLSASQAFGAPNAKSVPVAWDAVYERFGCASEISLAVSGHHGVQPDLIVGMEPDPGLDRQFELAQATVFPLRSGKLGQPAFANLSGAVKAIAPCRIQVSLPPSGAARAVLHLRVHPKTRVTLEINSQLSTSFVVTHGAILHKGMILTDRGPRHALAAMAIAYSENPSGSGPELVRDNTGRFNILPQGVRRHLIETPNIALSSRAGASLACCKAGELVTFRVRISPDGRVVEAKPGNISDSQVEALTDFVESLQFKPFMVDGVMVPAEGVLPLLVLDQAAPRRILVGY